MRYRVYCNLVVEADSPQEVFEFLGEDADFVEKHIIIEEDSPAADLLPHHDTDEVYADIRRRYK